MKSIFYIAPHYNDNEFYEKLKILRSLAEEHQLIVLVGEKVGKEFDVDLTAKRHQDADVFIADLSFERPSCYYELGWAVGKGKPVFLVASVGTPIHQKQGDVIFYKDLVSFKVIVDSIFKKIKEN